MDLRRGLLAASAMALLLTQPAARAGDIELRAPRQVVRIATQGGLPVYWLTCDRPCDEPGAVRQLLVGAEGGGTIRWSGDDPALATQLAGIEYRAKLLETSAAVAVVLTALDHAGGVPRVQRYELSRRTDEFRMRLQLPRGVGLRLATGADFVPAPLPGFGAGFGDVEAVRVTGSGQERLDAAPPSVGEAASVPGEWVGIRSRFWAWLARPAEPAEVEIGMTTANRPAVDWHSPAAQLDLVFYAGPVEWSLLQAASPDLTHMLFATLWEPLRWLCFGLLFLLGLILHGVGNPGVAIVLLSLVAKLLLFPLTRIADRWQAEVNRAQARLQPRLEVIRRQYRGEEAHNLTLQAYREEGVHPLFTMKSLAGFTIQVPMFIAAFDMLADNYALSGARFLWIDDLSAPDRLAALPAALPFFGAYFNLLPLIMTLLTVLSALTQRDASLTPALLKKQQRQLYVMAAGFFLLFYTFPAGMVLYWTANNFWHLVKIQVLRLVG